MQSQENESHIRVTAADTLDDKITNITNDIGEIRTRRSTMGTKDRTQLKISLDDAVMALKDIKSDFEKADKSMGTKLQTQVKDGPLPKNLKAYSVTMMMRR